MNFFNQWEEVPHEEKNINNNLDLGSKIIVDTSKKMKRKEKKKR